MHYVIAAQFISAVTPKKSYTFQAGEIVSRHKVELAAWDRYRAMDKRTETPGGFLHLESSEDLAVGEIRLDLLEALKADNRDREALSLAVQLLKHETGRDEIDNMDVFARRLDALDMDAGQLMAGYQERAQEVIDEREKAQQERAQESARREATKAEVTQARDEMVYSFPAVRGIQAGREYYAAQVPYRYLTRLFVFDDDVVPPEARAQRQLNEKRAKAIGEYVCENPTDYVLPALTASVSAEMSFEAYPVPGASDRVGMLHIPMDATILINDGQHRRSGIESAVARMPALKDETISVTIFYDCGLARSQQMFADINGNANKPSSSLNALYDRRDTFNQWVLAILDDMPSIKGRVEMESASVGRNSHKLWSLVGFRKFISYLTGVTKTTIEDQGEDDLATMRAGVVAFLDRARECLPMWDQMLTHKIPAPDLRDSYVVGHAVFLEALGLFGADLLQAYRDQDAQAFEPLQKLVGLIAERNSRFWEGRCVVNGRMQKTTDGVKSTAAVLLGMAELEMRPDIAEVNDRVIQQANEAA